MPHRLNRGNLMYDTRLRTLGCSQYACSLHIGCEGTVTSTFMRCSDCTYSDVSCILLILYVNGKWEASGLTCSQHTRCKKPVQTCSWHTGSSHHPVSLYFAETVSCRQNGVFDRYHCKRRRKNSSGPCQVATAVLGKGR